MFQFNESSHIMIPRIKRSNWAKNWHAWASTPDLSSNWSDDPGKETSIDFIRLKLIITIMYVSQLSLLEMHLGGERPVTWCRPVSLGTLDLILFITGVGSTQQRLWAAVLALLVLWPLSMPNALVHNELNYWAGRYVCAPWMDST